MRYAATGRAAEGKARHWKPQKIQILERGSIMKLSKNMVEILLEEFKTLSEALPDVQNNIKDKMCAKLTENRVIEISELKEIETILIPIRDQLKQYTDGFPSYLRSIGKMEPEAKDALKSQTDKVREVLKEARELEVDLEWIVNHYLNKIKIQNMKFGYFELNDGKDQTEKKEEAPPEKLEPVSADPEAL